MEKFEAQVQYRDWHGEVKADDGDFTSIRDAMRERQLLNEDEMLIAVRGSNAENLRNQDLAPVYITALVIPATDFESAQRYLAETDPIQAREVRFELSVVEWARLFKRFSVAMQWQSFKVVGRNYEADE